MPRGRCERGRLQRDNTRWHRAASVLIATSALLSLGALGADPARAGTYVLRSCNVPGHPFSPLAPWTAAPDAPNMVVVDACEAGGGVGFRFVGQQELLPGRSPRVALAKPSRGPQSQIKLVKVSLWYAARLGGTGLPLTVFSRDAYADNTTNRYWTITSPPGAENLGFEQQLNPANTSVYSVALVCGPALSPHPPDPCLAEDPMPFQVRGMEVTLSEDVLPTVLQPAGTLLSGGSQSGVRGLSYAATDPESGLAQVDVLLGDTVVKTHDLTTRCFYSDFTVCPASDDETLEIDTRLVPNGPYRLTLRVRDAAGNQRVVHSTRAIEIANPSSPGSSEFRRYSLSANFKGSSRSTLTVPYGRRVSVRGRLTHGSQPAAAGTAIDVRERLDRRGSRERVTRKIKTKADGSFSLGLATSRPSRVVRLAFRPAGGGQLASRALTLRVRAASRVNASLRGRMVRFSGRVLSGPIPKGGKRLQMEGRSTGSAWTPFKSLRTDKTGRFSGTYLLRVRRPGVTIKIRALVSGQAGYGYLASRSRAVTMRVR